VDFRKPDIDSLKKAGYTLVDMHFHTRYSDTYTPVRKVLAKAKRLGIGVAITDHNEIQGCIEAYRRKDGQLIIPGIEVTCYERCHMLAYFSKIRELEDFYYNHVEPCKTKNPYTVTKLKTSQFLKASRDYDCVTAAAHPFAGFQGVHKNMKRRSVHPGLLNKIEAIEVQNGALLKWMNWQALQWAEQTGKCFTGGSDGHTLLELGNNLTYSKARSVAGFLKSILNKDNYVIGRQIGLVTHLNAKSRVAVKHLRYLRPTLMIRYEVTLKPTVKYHVPRIKNGLKKARSISIQRVRDVAERGMHRMDYSFERMGPNSLSKKQRHEN
jgi:predicted metal-dependent phosphoesterase TrpH